MSLGQACASANIACGHEVCCKPVAICLVNVSMGVNVWCRRQLVGSQVLVRGTLVLIGRNLLRLTVAGNIKHSRKAQP